MDVIANSVQSLVLFRQIHFVHLIYVVGAQAGFQLVAQILSKISVGVKRTPFESIEMFSISFVRGWG